MSKPTRTHPRARGRVRVDLMGGPLADTVAWLDAATMAAGAITVPGAAGMYASDGYLLWSWLDLLETEHL